MATFVSKNFFNDSNFLLYQNGDERVFIGRFKYSRSPIKKSHFKSFLVKNKIEVEVYVELCKTLPPLKALVELGFDLDAILYAKK